MNDESEQFVEGERNANKRMTPKQIDALTKKFGPFTSSSSSTYWDEDDETRRNLFKIYPNTYTKARSSKTEKPDDLAFILLDPKPRELDLFYRFKHEALPQVMAPEIIDGVTIVNFVEPNEVTMSMYLIPDRADNGIETGLMLMPKILLFMRDLYNQGIYVYPALNSIYINFTNTSRSITDRFLYIPIEEEISYKPVTEAEYLARNYSFFNRLLLRLKPSIDPNEDPAIGPNANVSKELMPHIDNFQDTLKVMQKWIAGRKLTYRPYVPIREISPSPYIKVTQSLADDLVTLIETFSSMHQPLSALFMGIDLLFRTGNLQGVDELIRAVYKDEFVAFRPDSLAIIAMTGGRLFYNPVFNEAKDLTQLVTAYKQIITSQPDLYPQVDIFAYFAQMKSNNSSKNITINQFFK
jgi:hypothetical protein